MTLFYIEEIDGKFEVCSDSGNGCIDVHESYDTLAEAQADIASIYDGPTENFYHAQMAYACGYHD